MRALNNDLSAVSSVRHDRQGSAANGTGVDCAAFEGAVAILDVAALGGTTPNATYVLQESDDNSVFTAVAAVDLMGGAQPAAFTVAGLAQRGYIGAKRYLRWALTVLTGTSPTVTATGQITRGYARHAPAGVTQAP